jgi:hypothetical protein
MKKYLMVHFKGVTLYELCPYASMMGCLTRVDRTEFGCFYGLGAHDGNGHILGRTLRRRYGHLSKSLHAGVSGLYSMKWDFR